MIQPAHVEQDHMMRHRNYQLRLNKDGADKAFRGDAAFHILAIPRKKCSELGSFNPLDKAN